MLQKSQKDQKDAKRESADAVMARLTFTTELEALAGADLVVENVPEKWAIKSEVYPRLDAIAPERAIFAVDTSCFSITKVGALTRRPERVIGIHFMNPVPLKPMVEVIRGYHTSEATIESAKAFLRQMGKDCVVVNDMPGFVSNRVLMLTVNEAIFLVQDGVAEADQIDLLFRSCFGHRAYTAERRQFGVPLADHQLIRRLLTDMTVDVRAARLLCLRAGFLRAEGDPGAMMETMAAKYFASRLAVRAANDAVQIHGANGCTDDYPVGRYLRDAKVMEIIEGSTQIQQITLPSFEFSEF